MSWLYGQHPARCGALQTMLPRPSPESVANSNGGTRQGSAMSGTMQTCGRPTNDGFVAATVHVELREVR